MYLVIVYSPQQAQLLQTRAQTSGCSLIRTPTPRGIVQTCAYSYYFDETCFETVKKMLKLYNIKIHGIYKKVEMFGKDSYQRIL
ncbi:putative Se/S carrier-like protein [Calorimonas adulescens]|uniref:DUF3343 domain-containing protein n=1 Tax=Calorimonas adulescens TaxID=2606906 RepID=A0A5D8QG94_9THEO|nr:putative Se/S carrier-like protein [Calorimonas adulescens]TZE82268.1 DUF3343 domain-containing protein [Calorimonas adulescens]